MASDNENYYTAIEEDMDQYIIDIKVRIKKYRHKTIMVYDDDDDDVIVPKIKSLQKAIFMIIKRYGPLKSKHIALHLPQYEHYGYTTRMLNRGILKKCLAKRSLKYNYKRYTYSL